MKKLFFLFSLSLFSLTLSFAQQMIERKIVVEKGKFYYTTIDDKFQIATLHTGKYAEPLKLESALAMPAGRNLDEPVIPFSWDVSGANIFAVNFLMHPMNDRNEALKKIELSTLKAWDEKTSVIAMVLQSTESSPFAYNDPYRFIISHSNILSGFFFDGITMADGTYWMAISNNDELSIWKYDGIAWKHGDVASVNVAGPFSLFAQNGNLFLMLSDGKIKSVTAEMKVQDSKLKGLESAVEDGLLVINKDDNTIKFIKAKELDQKTPLKELVEKKALGIL